jgi:hemerythrin
MSYLEFKEEEKVGIQSIDQEHDKISEIINSIHDDVLVVNKTLTLNHFQSLLEILDVHFKNEEKLMKETNFLGYISHKLEHDRFYNEINKLKEGIEKGTSLFGLEQLKGIRRWFLNHIELNDRKCAQHLIEKGYS